MKKCQFCGESIPDDAPFCQFCGKKVVAQVQQHPQPPAVKPASPAPAPVPQNQTQTPPAGAAPNSPQNNISIVDKIGDKTCSASIIQWNSLTGSSNIANAGLIYHAEKVGMKLRQVVLTINNSSIITEPGALHFMKGNIEIKVDTGGFSGALKRSITSSLTNETMYRPTYTGTGVIYLEPGFGHYLLVQIDQKTVVDKGIFYAAQSSVEVGVEMQKNLSAGFAGGEGWFQTKLTGPGWAVLTSPVPANEIVKIKLNNEKLSVDGNFAMLRKGNIEYKVEKSVKSFFGSSRSGEGLLQTFSGSGEVWLAPTQSIYERASRGNAALSSLSDPNQKSANTNVRPKLFSR